ncbi:hypothetical protein TTHERM_00300300 (macronuclear) [Tetrahymena thermophila SB210]|uniref:Uncharacterized protein n=1 Tax=Tetrahymena thermophila (strain SB210) TaxID=312017 RepID=I7M3U4_TETTS|nr:hypothetical protein TTHERM_00300300 [Tetrahymena thermophila SB210]EAS04312.3 hypothetical protein TTHERM_00300300 [Tetrahymena thermophila SB210]|eukprot:XP_001024557.3 hypothetical protein TTHERM_00300300 [Tetrahymena thermophila SB210]
MIQNKYKKKIKSDKRKLKKKYMGKKTNQTEKTQQKSVQKQQPKKQKKISKQKQYSQKQTVKSSKNKQKQQIKIIKVQKSAKNSIKKTSPKVSKKSQTKNKTQSIVSRLSINEGNIPKQYALIKQELLSCREIVDTELINTKHGYHIIKKSLKGQCRAEDIQKEIKQRTIKQDKIMKKNKLEQGMIDIVFCCNTIGISQFQKQIKNSIYQMMQVITKKYYNQPISVRFGFVAYRDHWDITQTYVTCTYDLDQKANIKKFVQSIKELNWGLGALDGLYMASKYISWRDNTIIPSLRYIFHLVNSNPNCKQNGFDNEKPCKCGLDVDQVAEIINNRQIHYRYIDCHYFHQKSKIDEMKTILKNKLNDYEECKLFEASQMDLRFQDITLGPQLFQPAPNYL